MSDDPKQRGKPDRSRINLSEEHEVRYWTRELGVSEEKLRGAIAALGSSSATRVREFLRTIGLA
jgi:hypothetical protein